MSQIVFGMLAIWWACWKPKKRQKERRNMEWEYKIEKIVVFDRNYRSESEKMMNELGEAGWEAVSVWRDASVDKEYVLFKREK